MNQDLLNNIHFEYKIMNLLIENSLGNTIGDGFVRLVYYETFLYHVGKSCCIQSIFAF